MNPDSNICYIVGAMSLTPDLRPYPTRGDCVIAAELRGPNLIRTMTVYSTSGEYNPLRKAC